MYFFKLKQNFTFAFVLGICAFVFIAAQETIAQADTLWSEDWEGDWLNNWHTEAGTWEVGMPTSGPRSSFSGDSCAATILTGNYTEPVDSRLIRHISFKVPSAEQNPRLRFWHWYSFSSNDYGNVQVKTNGGQWTPVSENYTRTSCNYWTNVFIDLSQYADSTIQIAFFFHSRASWNGGNVSTGWYIDEIALITGPLNLVEPETWEKGINDWYVDFCLWQVGQPTKGPSTAHSGENCAATVLDGNYCEPRDTRLISPWFYVPVKDSIPALRFWHWYSFSSNDYGNVQIRTKEDDWAVISDNYGNTSGNIWTNTYFDLSAYADSLVQISFYFHSAPSWNGGNISTGWYIDDIEINGYMTGFEEKSDYRTPSGYLIYQNYPNPFNPTTTIKYALPKAGTVKLEVFNLLGQKVATLVNSRKAAGNHHISFNGSGLASGVYYYRLETGRFVRIRKMVLVK